MNKPNPLISVRGLKKYYPVKPALFRRIDRWVRAVDGVDLDIEAGETVGLVGESGCGKTSLARTLVRLETATAGHAFFDTDPAIVTRAGGYETDPDSVRERERLVKEFDYLGFPRKEMTSLRKKVQIVFQDPYGSLNPRMTVLDIVAEGLDVQRKYRSARERRELVLEIMNKVGLEPAMLDRYPHEFSGGQRQRIGIARALIMRPAFLVLDEPVSALDVSIQAQILKLINKLKAEFDLTYLVIAHDLSVVEYISDRVAVMYLGKIVEFAPKTELYERRLHPYTRALVSAAPVLDPHTRTERIILKGDVPSAIDPPPGCAFHPRCPKRFEPCDRETPVLKEVSPGHSTACWLYK